MVIVGTSAYSDICASCFHGLGFYCNRNSTQEKA
jgi:hypothetical protein